LWIEDGDEEAVAQIAGMAVTQKAERALWAWRRLRDMDPALRADELRDEQSVAYTVPATAQVASRALKSLGLDPAEHFGKLRGRSVAHVWRFVQKAREGEDRERVLEAFCRQYPPMGTPDTGEGR
jgi:hypothetical protein